MNIVRCMFIRACTVNAGALTGVAVLIGQRGEGRR